MPTNRLPTTDPDADAARVLLHRATAVLRSAVIGATDLDPPEDEEPMALVAVGPDRIARQREKHRTLLEGHLRVLGEYFARLAGVQPPDDFGERAGRAPQPDGGSGDDGPPSSLWTDIRRTEWAAYGLERILQTYGERAPRAAIAVRRACDDLRAWAQYARTAP